MILLYWSQAKKLESSTGSIFHQRTDLLDQQPVKRKCLSFSHNLWLIGQLLSLEDQFPRKNAELLEQSSQDCFEHNFLR